MTSAKGRLTSAVAPDAAEILFDRHLRPPADPVAGELWPTSDVDRAHVVMLTEQGIVRRGTAARLLAGIDALRAAGFAPLRDRPAPRGRYLAYESYLVETLGEETGGVLHSGRSRNDLNATVLRLQLRGPYDRLRAETDALGRALTDRAHRSHRTVMPAYTHHQPAVPVTYGHYLAGVAAALVRDLEQLEHAGREIDENPLGAGATGGTTLPVDPRRTTELLGFAVPLANSLHAVASRDLVLRLLSACSVLGVLLTRVAHDLQSWTSAENPLLRLPDDLVGSSSMMPQKRNPFLLENIQGKAAVALGAFTAATTAMSTARYTNAIAVGTEAVGHIWPALEATTDAVLLLRLVITGAEPDAELMRRRAAEGLTAATALAERLVVAGIPFRTAHHEVGDISRVALNTGRPFEEVAAERLAGRAPNALTALDPSSIVCAATAGGGPAPASVLAALQDTTDRLDANLATAAVRQARWATAEETLADAVSAVTYRS
ncbi:MULTISPECIES: argininosuccinate lyase [unclassified Streptomyces]|uniref:argininosuccinate lyase n=1 Tax=unclassified Streptomyces TaxID=2593676 RepID=UPI0029B1AB08|nr:MULTISPECIES: argininosuccinate lyase [unclassified Streptomyces]MDX3771717.1 argininosuccinate lyase [Streptomyces sp. AK08-01B]MDX3821307.1 argininosuccinate lyase [Streptomyces sp. AK08-01A]